MAFWKDPNTNVPDVLIREIAPKDAEDILKAGFPFYTEELHYQSARNILEAAKLVPRTTKLVAYHVEKKRAIGFLSLVEHTASLYSIKFVFSDPEFRKMGIGTKLINFASSLARERGAQKIHLDVAYDNTQVIGFYEKRGFKKLGNILVGQGHLSRFPRLRMIGHTLVGRGYLAKFLLKKEGQLVALRSISKDNKELLFGIYSRYVDQKWNAFFDINPENLVKGYLNGWQPLYLRDLLVNNSLNSFVLVFNRPFFSDAKVEVYSHSETIIPSVLDDLTRILFKRGISYTHITLFSISDTCVRWFKEKGLETLKFVVMGKNLQ